MSNTCEYSRADVTCFQAMIYFLENHGPAKFSEIYLGEFDTPEAIWMSEMRRTMIQKIALHLGDFKPRLMCNTRALYQVICYLVSYTLSCSK